MKIHKKRRLQKLYGAGLVAVGIVSALIELDITAAVVLVPLGVWMLASKSLLIY